MIRISNIKIGIEEAVNKDLEQNALCSAVLSQLRIKSSDLKKVSIFKKSIDVRKKEKIFFVYTVDADIVNENRFLNKPAFKGVIPTPDMSYKNLMSGTEKMANKPIIVGMGPSGLFAGLFLARRGYSPIILERGENVDARTAKVAALWESGILDSESNVQFGEGGAGTFSDGKLTTLINDARCHAVLQEFVDAGAPLEIMFSNKPHIGTDILKSVVKIIREKIISYGGDVRFNSKVTDFTIGNGKLKALEINGNEYIPCEIVLLAIGHSARDTFFKLHEKGIVMTGKPFSIGVRIEHPQELINKAQYGTNTIAKIGAADYKLSYHSASGRSAYTFCMCPGGFVVAAASEQGYLVTNGMSEYKRDGFNANSALLVGVTPADFGSNHPLSGVEFQRKWERLAFEAGGGGYRAPAQLVGDFLADKLSTKWGSIKPTYKPGVVFARIKDCLPDYVVETMKEAIPYFNTRVAGFAMQDAILTGVETRSSSPIRILRNSDFISNIYGIYPVGEGAGYAGGIMSSAVDGIKAAEKIIQKYSPWSM